MRELVKGGSMSKFGKIDVNVYAFYTVEQLTAFADRVGITFEQAESLAKEKVYRHTYNKLRNKEPEAKQVRHEYNRKRQQLQKMLGRS
jgi:hypothetical protein